MSVVDLLFNAAGGGILGSRLHIGTDWMDTRNKVTLMNAQVAAAEKTEAWKAFAASQGGGEVAKLPDNTPIWVSSVYYLVQSFKDFTRPGLAWAGVAILFYVFHNADITTRAALSSEFQFGAFTAIFWYFGARYSRGQK